MPAHRCRAARPVVATAVLLLAALLAACTPAGPGGPVATSAPPTPAGPAGTTGLARFYDQQPGWGPCAPFSVQQATARSYANRKLECARLTVPLDYARPDGPGAQIAVMRLPATGPDRIGSLLVNPGGPGGSGLEQVAGLAGRFGDTTLGKRFDLVGFDPRGVGASTPVIDCLGDAEADAERADPDVDPSPAGVAQIEAENRDFADKCAQRVGPQVLANVGTRDVARDLDVLRAVLGDEKLTFVGQSYGTAIGTAYAEAFPDRVRALVLDGAVDPTQQPVTEAQAQAAGFQQAFDAFAAWCAPRRDCPLGPDPAQATARYQQVVRPLLDRPVPASGGRVLTYPDAVLGTAAALYVEDVRPALQQALQMVAAGDGSLLLLIADLYYQRGEDGRTSNFVEAFRAIRCVDRPAVTDPVQVAALADRSFEAAPFQDPGRGGAVRARNECAFWPVPPTSSPHVPSVSGLGPTLVVSTTGDPATPYAAGVALARVLGGRLLTVEGAQHTATLQGDRCVDEAVTAYLVDLTLPPDGTRCGSG